MCFVFLQIYLIVISFTALTVPATRHTFDHFLPFTCTAWDTAYRGWEGWVTGLPAHGVNLGGETIEEYYDTY